MFGRSYARAWEMMRDVVAVHSAGVGWIVGDGLIGSGDVMGELIALNAGVVPLDEGVAVVGEMSTRHNRAPECSRTPWRMVLPSLLQTRS